MFFFNFREQKKQKSHYKSNLKWTNITLAYKFALFLSHTDETNRIQIKTNIPSIFFCCARIYLYNLLQNETQNQKTKQNKKNIIELCWLYLYPFLNITTNFDSMVYWRKYNVDFEEKINIIRKENYFNSIQFKSIYFCCDFWVLTWFDLIN